MKRAIIILVAICFAAGGLAWAQDNPIKERQAIMKKNGADTKLATQMIKGEKPYDAAAAAEAMTSISNVMDKFVTLFPEGSTSKDSYAKPEIWQDMADFKSHAQEVKEASAAAAEAAPAGVDTFKGAFVKLGQACNGCHEKYRIKQ